MSTISESEYQQRIAALENWRPVPDMPLYEVSSYGRVRSLGFRNNQIKKLRAIPLLMKPSLRKADGYYVIRLSIDNYKRQFLLHQLVLLVFRGPCPAGLQGAHLDGDKSNNCLTNLKWVTAVENNNHKIMHGTLMQGELVPSARLREKDISVIVQRLRTGEPERSIATDFGVSRSAINFISRGKTWKRALNSIGNELTN